MSTCLNYDIGHCETTATTINVNDGKNAVVRLKLDGNHNDVISTAVSLTFDQIQKLGASRIDVRVLESLGDIRIGEDAITQPKDGEYFVYFKTSPESFDKPCGRSREAREAKLTCGKLMAVFIYQIIQNTLRFNPAYAELSPEIRSDLSLLIGCPATSKWTDEKNRQAYARLIRTATGIDKVSIVPESRAAVFSAVSTTDKAVSSANGVMVFDFGSSTVDCTYMLLGRQIMEYSWDLGASLIEQQLLMNALSSAREKESTADFALKRDSMLRSLREAKEEYYRIGAERDVVCRFERSDGKTLRELIAIDEDAMERVTTADTLSIRADSVTEKTGSWRKLCREFMEKGKAYLDANQLPCKAVVLTGGASHMDFIQEICEEVFDDGMTILRDSNPSYCVSTGLGWVAIADEQRDACIEEAKKLLQENSTCSYDKLKNAITDGVCAYIFDLVEEETTCWANQPGSLPVRDLEKRIDSRMKQQADKDAVKEIIEREIDKWVVQFQAGATEAVNSQSRKIFSESIAADLIISDAVWKRMDANSIPVKLDAAKIIEGLDIASMLNKIVQFVVYWTVGIAVAVALSWLPVINLIAGYLAGTLAQVIVSDEDKDKPREQDKRKKIAKQMPTLLKSDKISGDIKDKIASAMTAVKEQYDSMLNDTVTIAIDMVMLRRFGEQE